MNATPPPSQDFQDETSPAGFPGLTPVVATSIVGTFVILLAAAAYVVRDFLLPIVLATLMAFTFAPLIRHLKKLGIPAAASSILLFAVLGGIAMALSALLTDPIANMIDAAPRMLRQVRGWLSGFSHPFATLNQASREIEAIAESAQSVEPGRTVVVAQPGVLSWVAGTLAGVGTTLAASLVLLPFFLGTGDSLKAKLVQVMPRLSRKKQWLHVVRDIENEISRYLLTTLAINVGLGTLVAIIMLLTGMPNPLLWGVGATFLNFIPWVGPWVGIALALVVAITTFSTPVAILIPPVSYAIFSILEGTVVTPLTLGRRLELSVVAIIITVSLTTWVWGVIGAIIGVPLLVVIKVFCDRFPSLTPVAVLLAAEPRLHDDVETPASQVADEAPQPAPTGTA